MKTTHHFLILSIFSLFIASCSKKEGCTDPKSLNFDAQAEKACENCCTYPIDSPTDTTDTIIPSPSLYETRWNLLTSKDKWYWRESILLTYSCTTDALTDSSHNYINSANSYTQYGSNNTGLFQNGNITNPYSYCGLSPDGTILKIKYQNNPQDTIFYTINTLNDTLLRITANSSWCAQFGSYYFQTEVLKTSLD